MDQAAAFGYKKVAITDRNTLAGIVRAHAAAKEKTFRSFPPVAWIYWMGQVYWLILRTKMLIADFRLY
ncbi:hypothetical protein [Pedobacter panaciterrae]